MRLQLMLRSGSIIFRAMRLGASRNPSSIRKARKPASKGNSPVLATRKFGITCPICKRFCFLGYVELDEHAAVGELRLKLLRDGWKGEIAKCDHSKCDGEIFCPWNAAVFPR
jgi:hypothetical protein